MLPTAKSKHKSSAETFFDRNTKLRSEIIAGLIREGQLVAFAGPFGTGKSPALADLAICVVHGIPWYGREASPRPVIVFDFETPAPSYKRTISNISRRYGVALPRVPEELEVYLALDDAKERPTAKLLDALRSRDTKTRLGLVRDALQRKPNAIVIIDPLELLFRLDTREKTHVLGLFVDLRFLLSEFPQAALIPTFNLRKRDKRTRKADLLQDPRGWLEEVCGSLDIMNRSDVRLGMDFHDEEARVINGIRRGEEMHPLLIRPVGDSPKNLAGFEPVPAGELNLDSLLTAKQHEYWRKLPDEFRYEDVVPELVPKSSFSRLSERAKSVRILEQHKGVYHKLSAKEPWRYPLRQPK